MPPRIYLYAEILTHIRQLTLHASLQTEKEEGTKLDVSTDKKVISVTHDGETQKLYLPTQISGDAQITFPLKKKTEISARVQIGDEHEWKCMINNEIEAPWIAADLTTNTAIQCRRCEASIVSAGAIKQWKDLPSENWADLMDFWFCHKPHDEDQDDAQEAATAKGFSSRSRLAVSTGTGMTDLISIVLHADDCSNVKAAETQKKPDATVLRCDKCLEMLGTTNQEEDLVRLHKPSISIDKTGTLGTYESYPSTMFTCAQLLSLIEATALKKFVVHSPQASADEGKQEQNAEAILLWIFNPDIYYSCSAYEGNGVLSNAPISEPVQLSNPNNDNTSNIYDNQPPSSKGGNLSPAAALDQDAADRNPNNHNTAAIYGETVGPQFVSGDLEFEVPIREKAKAGDSEQKESEDTPASTFADIPIESIEETETPLVSSKQASESQNGTTASQASSHVSRAPAATQHGPPQSNEHINLVHRAAKIFYKPVPSDQSVASFLDANSNTHEDLYLPNPADLISLRATLEKSTAMLPSSARSFQDWSVGLLNRYEKVPSGLGVMQENPLARGKQSGRCCEDIFATIERSETPKSSARSPARKEVQIHYLLPVPTRNNIYSGPSPFFSQTAMRSTPDSSLKPLNEIYITLIAKSSFNNPDWINESFFVTSAHTGNPAPGVGGTAKDGGLSTGATVSDGGPNDSPADPSYAGDDGKKADPRNAGPGNPAPGVGGTAKDGGMSTAATVADGGPNDPKADPDYKP